MRAKNACLIINPRTGENLARLTDILAVMSAAGWDTDILIKEYGGQTLQLAKNAGKQKYDLVIGYGGDGTLNQVVNGVVYAQNGRNGHNSTVALLPGGTANVWANEVGISTDPVKSALTLVSSRARDVDLGHVEVEGLTFPPTAGESSSPDNVKSGAKKRKANTSTKARHNFLLMAGLGIDAAVMGHVSKSFKYRVGPLAVGASAVKELPEQRPFPVAIYAAGSGGKDVELWKGEALQVVIGNTRKYADIVEMTPGAYIDDGSLDVSVITSRDALTTVEQVMSLLLRRKPDNVSAEYFHGPHLRISVPATIAMQVDGTAVKLKDYLSKQDRAALRDAADPGQVMVTYRFDAMPKALSVAIPSNYDNALFESPRDRYTTQVAGEQRAGEEQRQTPEAGEQSAANQPEGQKRDDRDQHVGQNEQAEVAEPLPLGQELQRASKVKVIGASRNPDKKQPFYVIAGTTGESRPVAVRVNGNTTLLRRSGGVASPTDLEALPEDAEIAVEGKESKRGVIAATTIVI